MISTVDGRAAADGRSAALGDEADLEMLLELRTLADAVLIGTGTLRAEGYARLVRNPERRARRRAAGMADDPLAVLITRGFEIPWEAGLFQAPEQPVLICTGRRGRAARTCPRPSRSSTCNSRRWPGCWASCARAASARCSARPARRCTGRSSAEGLVDELFLTVAPLLTGDPDEPAIVAGGRLPGGRGPAARGGPAPRVGAVPAVRRIGSAPMRIEGAGALVAGGASGLGRRDGAAPRRRRGARDDRRPERREGRGAGRASSARASRAATSPTPRRSQAAVEAAGDLRISVVLRRRGLGREDRRPRGPHSFEPFQTVIR